MFSPYLLLVNLELMVVNCLAPRHKGICGKLTGIQFGQLFPGIDIYLASYLIEAIAIAVVANVFPTGFSCARSGGHTANDRTHAKNSMNGRQRERRKAMSEEICIMF